MLRRCHCEPRFTRRIIPQTPRDVGARGNLRGAKHSPRYLIASSLSLLAMTKPPCNQCHFCYNCAVKISPLGVAPRKGPAGSATSIAVGLLIVTVLSISSVAASPPAQQTAIPTQTQTTTRTPTRTRTVAPKLGATSPNVTATPTLTLTLTPTDTPTSISAITATETITASPNTPVTANPSETPRQVAAAAANPKYTLSLDVKSLSIDSLRARRYLGGPIKITRVLSSSDAFRRVLFEYPSDGLRITGMMDIPRGNGLFPVVILDHGYFKPSEYKPGDGTSHAADAFARAGYLTLAPDYRCYAGSQCGPNPLYVGYAIDVLNLIASLPSLPYADTSRIGIWGHSMGGGITIRVLTLNDRIKVAALYGALSADDEVHYCWLYACRAPLVPTREPTLQVSLQRRHEEADPEFLQGLDASAQTQTTADPKARLHEIFLKSSPSRYLSYFNAPVIIHHGEKDDIVPIQWSIDLADSLNGLGKPASLYTYPGEGHVFTGWNWQLFMARTISFFNEYLNPQSTPITAGIRVLRRENALLDSSY